MKPNGSLCERNSGDAHCPLRRLDKALRKYDLEMRRSYGDRAGTNAREGEGLPRHLTVDDFITFLPDHRYIHLPTGILWPAASVDARVMPIDVGGDKPMSASKWLDRNRHCEQMTWAPGKPSLIRDTIILEGGFCARRGNTIYNLYRPPAVEPGDPEQAGPWLDLLRRLYPSEAEEIIDFFAARVQRPHVKTNHILVLGGAPGIGKDSLLVPVIHAIGEWNYAGISPSQLLGRFNGFLKSVLLVINEARDLGETNSYAFYEHLKPIAAAPPDTLRIDMKNMQEFKIPNVVGVVITTNYLHTGLYLPPNDRRHFVAWSDHPGAGEEGALSSDYFDKFHDWLENQGGKKHVVAYLQQRDLSMFNPKAPPRKTPAFNTIVGANRGEEESTLADTIDAMRDAATAQGRELIAFSRDQLIDAASGSGELQEWLRNPKYRRILPMKLRQFGYVAVINPDASDGLWRLPCSHGFFGADISERSRKRRRQSVYGLRSVSARELLRAARELQNEGEEENQKGYVGYVGYPQSAQTKRN